MSTSVMRRRAQGGGNEPLSTTRDWRGKGEVPLAQVDNQKVAGLRRTQSKPPTSNVAPGFTGWRWQEELEELERRLAVKNAELYALQETMLGSPRSSRTNLKERAKRLDAEVAELQAAHRHHTTNKPNLGRGASDIDLYLAAQFGHDRSIQALIECGVDVNKATENGRTALHWAAQYGHASIVQNLLAADADPNRADSYGRTPFYWAARYGHEDAVAVLLGAPGVDVNKANKRGWTPLHNAARYGHESIFEALLDANADPNHTDMYGQTPLHWGAYNTPLSFAAHQGQSNAVSALLASGADPGRLDTLGRTPQRWATQHGGRTNRVTEMLYNAELEGSRLSERDEFEY